MKITIQSFHIQKFSQSEILNMIEPSKLEEIKKDNPHPFFKVYSFLHEGTSTPKILGEKSKPISWGRKAVQSVKDAMVKGLKFFLGHNSNNSTENREALGEVVATKEIEIDGKLHKICIGYFKEPEKVKDLDIVSHEAEWNLIESAGKIIADSIDSITGLALGNSRNENPAFQDARQLAEIQCFADGMPVENINQDGSSEKGIKMSVTKKEVIDFIRENGLHIHEVGFTFEDAKQDRILGKVIEDYENKIKGFSQKEVEYQKEKDSFAKKIKEFTDKDNLNSAKVRFGELVKGMKLNESEKTFIETKFNIDKVEDFSDDGLNKYVESKRSEYKLIEPVFKKNTNTPIFQPGNNIPADLDDFTKAANNPLLDSDFNPYQNG